MLPFTPPPDRDAVRLRVSVADVAAAYDLPGGPERFLCPFHGDGRRPNLVALPPREGDPVNRYYCNSCGAKGDVIDLVRHLAGCGYIAALRRLGELLEDAPEPEVRQRKRDMRPDPEWHERLIEHRERARSHAAVGLLSYAAGWRPADPLRDEFLIERLGWGLDEAARVVVPHFNPECELSAVKVRSTPPEPRFMAYGSMRWLYMSDQVAKHPAPEVVLCEGETDAAEALYQLETARCFHVNVLGLPSGAGGMGDDWVRLLRSYERVYLAIDPDSAGERAVERWREALPDAIRLPLPEGHDVRESASVGVMIPDLIECPNREEDG